MRSLTYNCYTDGVLVKNVKTYKEAIDWIEAQDGNEFSEYLTDIPRVLTEKEIEKREKRLVRIAEKLATV